MLSQRQILGEMNYPRGAITVSELMSEVTICLDSDRYCSYNSTELDDNNWPFIGIFWLKAMQFQLDHCVSYDAFVVHKALGKISPSSDWDSVHDSFDSMIINEVVANPEKYGLDEYHYDVDGDNNE